MFSSRFFRPRKSYPSFDLSMYLSTIPSVDDRVLPLSRYMSFPKTPLLDLTYPLWHPTNSSISSTFESSVKEIDNNFQIDFQIPGISTENILVDIQKDNILHVRIEDIITQNSVKVFGMCTENTKGFYERYIELNGERFDIENIDATHDNGILSITIPKKSPSTKSFYTKVLLGNINTVK